jgi:hypothetical protein
MIVIALAALAYTWFSGIFASLTSTAGTAVTTTTTAMATQFRIESARNHSSTAVTVLIRNIGTQDFDASATKTGIYMDGLLVFTIVLAECKPTCTNNILVSGGTARYTFNVPTGTSISCSKCPGACTNDIKVTITTGLIDTYKMVCG